MSKRTTNEAVLLGGPFDGLRFSTNGMWRAFSDGSKVLPSALQMELGMTKPVAWWPEGDYPSPWDMRHPVISVYLAVLDDSGRVYRHSHDYHARPRTD